MQKLGYTLLLLLGLTQINAIFRVRKTHAEQMQEAAEIREHYLK
jgi:hypothetical protein